MKVQAGAGDEKERGLGRGGAGGYGALGIYRPGWCSKVVDLCGDSFTLCLIFMVLIYVSWVQDCII